MAYCQRVAKARACAATLFQEAPNLSSRMRARPLLAVGLPIYNPGRFLAPALQSIFAQTFQDWELILVDDGSDDGSTELLSLIRDPRVRLLKSGLNLGLAARLNQIVQAARAPYLARMDADDMLDVNRLEKQVNYLMDHPNVDVVGCGLVILDEQGKATGLRLFDVDHARICADPMKGVRLAHATVVGKTQWFRTHPYNEKNRSCEDWELWLTSYKTSTFANLREPLYFYREFGSFSIGKYIEAKSWMARLGWHQRADFGLLRTASVCLSQYLRIVFALLAHLTGLQHHMIGYRSKSIDEDARAHALAASEESLKNALPLMRTTDSASTRSERRAKQSVDSLFIG
jgi:glycosyltransferase involved in cell wall biosynthesis